MTGLGRGFGLDGGEAINDLDDVGTDAPDLGRRNVSLAERYVNGHAALHCHFSIDRANRYPSKFCAVIERSTGSQEGDFQQIHGTERDDLGIDDFGYRERHQRASMLVSIGQHGELGEWVRVGRVASTVWLTSVDECPVPLIDSSEIVVEGAEPFSGLLGPWAWTPVLSLDSVDREADVIGVGLGDGVDSVVERGPKVVGDVGRVHAPGRRRVRQDDEPQDFLSRLKVDLGDDLIRLSELRPRLHGISERRELTLSTLDLQAGFAESVERRDPR